MCTGVQEHMDTEDQMKSRMIGYVRVSSREQGRNGLGLEAQRRAVKAACRERGWQLVRFEEDVRSAGKRLPARERALAACKTGEADGVVAAKLDRLSRSVPDCGRLLEDALKHGWNLVALDFGLDLSTPQGELVTNILTSVAR